MKKSIASLQERLAGWVELDHAIFELGACLGFWPDFGAPPEGDPWHGFEELVKANHANEGWVLELFLNHLVQAKVLERRDEPNTAYKWNTSYEIGQQTQEDKNFCHKCRGKCRPWNHAGGYWDPNKEGYG